MSINIRQMTKDDIENCGRIIYEAFKGIAEQHNFPLDFPNEDSGFQFADLWINHPSIYGVAAEENGRFIGSNFLTERNPIRGVGPITVSPEIQSRGVGRKLMEAVIERGKDAAGIRLVQDTFNTKSMSLYASLGFEVKEPLALMTGKPVGEISKDIEVRPMQSEDLDECEELSQKVHGFERTGELRDALAVFKPFVAIRGGKITAYSSTSFFWQLNHGAAVSEEDMRALLIGSSRQIEEPLSLLLPTRQASFHRWSLKAGMKMVKPMTLMAMGEYHEPRGCYFASVEY